MFKLSQESITIVTVGLALATLVVTGDNGIRSDMQAIRAEARADREAWQAEARALRACHAPAPPPGGQCLRSLLKLSSVESPDFRGSG